MNRIAEKNRKNWNAYAESYGRHEHSDAKLQAIVQAPQTAFEPATWRMLSAAIPSFHGLRVCVPSSGDNHAVFALALMGAQVTSCDISEKQLENAARAARALGLAIDFLHADTMRLDAVAHGAYDLIYTSNGVHVWIDDLPAMYAGIARALRPGGLYAMHEIHPFHRPFDGNELTALRVVKPYDRTGPFETEEHVTFGWRMQDILGAIAGAGLCIRRVEELQPAVRYSDPDWIPHAKKVHGEAPSLSREEIDRLYDWRFNPLAALPHWLDVVAEKL